MGARHNQTPNEMRRMLKMALKSNYAITFEISKPSDFFLLNSCFNSLCEMDKKLQLLCKYPLRYKGFRGKLLVFML